MSKKSTIIDLAHNGSGFCKNEDGKATFIPYAIPNEEVTYNIIKETKKYAIGEVSEINKKSNFRVEPKCDYFNTCGGCNLQHIETLKQRELKLEILEKTLSKQFNINPKEGYELIGKTLPDYNYRNRIKLSVSNEGKIGFLKSSSKEVVKINECKIVENEINEVIKSLSQFTFPKEAKEVLIQKTKNSAIILIKRISKKNLQKIRDKFPNLNFTTKSLISSFSQVNNFANEILVNKVTELVREPKITELYAGSGNFTFELAKRGTKITAIELDKALVAKGVKKQNELGLNNISFVCSKAEDYTKNNEVNETLLLDPPRTGAFEVVKNINVNNINRIVYVSCNPATLGRDLEVLKEKGFSVIKIYALDMFPQTTHLECICELIKI